MTREEKAREAYARAVEQLGGPARMSIAADIRADTSSKYYNVTMAAMLAFADAEAAAMRERAAGACEAKIAEFADAENAGNDEAEEAWHGGMAHAALVLADAIRALPTTEVGNG